MQNIKSMTKEKLANAVVTDGIGTDILKGTGIAMGAMAVGILGAWAVSCLVSGVLEAGGPIALIGQWFSAVTTM